MEIKENNGINYYEANNEPIEVFTLHVKFDGVIYTVTCDQEPGVFMAGKDLSKLLLDFENVVTTIKRLNKETEQEISNG